MNLAPHPSHQTSCPWIRTHFQSAISRCWPVHGQDFGATYSPVLEFALVRLILVLALNLGLYTRHVNVKTAFLNADVDRAIYATSPVNEPKKLRSKRLYKLLQAIYGLHQSSRRLVLSLTVSKEHDELRTGVKTWKHRRNIFSLRVFSDSDFEGDTKYRKSRTGRA